MVKIKGGYTTMSMSIYEIHKELGLSQDNDYRWNGVYGTGDFDAIHDYNAGILNVGISVLLSAKDKYTVMFHICTIDDGGWQAPDIKEDYDKEAVLARSKEIAESFIQFMDGSTKLPTEKELNAHLMTIGLWGKNTG
jgi:hypothetical protein